MSLRHRFPTFREFGDLIFKGEMSNKFLKIRPLRCIETSGIKYPVTRLHIKEQEDLSFTNAETKNLVSSYFICVFGI